MRIDFSKNTKFIYYTGQILRLCIPGFYYQSQLKKRLERAKNNPSLQKRLEYYNKLNENFEIPNEAKSIQEFRKTEKKKTYFFDLIAPLRYFKSDLKISYLFGDITSVPNRPAVLKSRPIEGKNENSILMKLNKVRHFIFVNDTIAFKDKKDMAVWRGKAYRDHRKVFVKKYYNHPLCNIGQTNTKYDLSVPWQKEKLSLKKQLEYKFILSIEGNDVASNLKWVMSSNSLSMMSKPKYETWFMEGTLIPNVHYVLLKDDYSDLEEKIRYYTEHTDEALAIIKNANAFVGEFLDEETEALLSLLVLEKFFKQSSQIPS
ncbi:MAG: glycosyl transferase family 90 [Campylobacterota bacterium]|nr:glycosyl transferase family 90 [Campylobacterota bacterium]